MRILIDLQGSQTGSRYRGIGRYSLDITKAILRNAAVGHEVFILLNGGIPSEITALREELDDLISQDHILVWEGVGPVAYVNLGNRWRQRANELIREAYICQQKPDVVILTTFFEGYGEEFTASIGRFDNSIPVVCIFYDLIPLLFPKEYLSHAWYSKWYWGRVDEVKKANYFLSISNASKNDAIQYFGIEKSRIVNISSAVSESYPILKELHNTRNLLSHLGINKPYLMYTSATDPRKNHLRLIEAYAKLDATVRKGYQLVLAGGLPKHHLKKFQKYANQHGLSADELIFTGQITDDEMKILYSQCRAFIFPSWYEGFGLPVLEAMQFNKAVIASNQSSIPEIIQLQDALFDPFSVTEMSEKIEKVLTDKDFRSALEENSIKAKKSFSWDYSAKVALAAITDWVSTCQSNFDIHNQSTPSESVVDCLIEKIRQLKLPHSDLDLIIASEAISLNHRSVQKRQLLVDISVLVERDAKTGIQRVVRNILREWLLNPPDGFIVKPVYASMNHSYRYANQFTNRFLNKALSPDQEDTAIEFSAGDCFVGLDLLYPFLAKEHAHFYQKMRNHGVIVQFIVYDLLPILLPQHSVEGASEGHSEWLKIVSQSDGLACISRAVANELKAWLQKEGIKTPKHFLVNWFHLGADPEIDQSGPLAPHKANLEEFKILASKPSFLSVGTLEPRKGHEQVLDSFEQLWEQGIDINLVFVGKQGWKVESLINRLKNHPEKSRRLFWFDGISDLHLNEIYQTCSCLIAASEGEGFGLPLIEAAHHGIPILARSIPVFHEVAGPNAFYFEGKHPQHLASAVQEWLQLSSKNKLVSSKDLPWLTWAQSAKRLEQALCLDGSRSKVL